MKKINPLKTPVLLIAFNRPHLTKLVLDQLRLVRPEKLYIAIDGPRDRSETDQVNQVKQLIKSVDWPCRVKTLYQKKNLGCKYGPVTAINWFFKQENKGIILEDDIIADPGFFYYCEKLLIKYEKDNRVGTIAGTNFTGISDGKSGYMFSRYSQTWGWATWRRAWKKYDINISDWPQKKATGWPHSFYWWLIFDAVYNQEITTAWDYQWTYCSWVNNFLTIIPSRNLVTNIGIGVPGATHTRLKTTGYQYPRFSLKFPLVHPAQVITNQSLDNQIQKTTYVLWKEIAMNLIRKLRLIYRSLGITKD